MEIKSAKDLKGNIQEKISKLYVEAFGKDMDVISKNPEKLVKAFTHMFVVDDFYVCIIDNEVVGMAACANKETYSIKHDKKVLIKELGLIKGFVANKIFKKIFTKPRKYAIEIDDKTGSIENVTTDSNYRNKGIATSIMEYIFALNIYEKYILEVLDTNENAIKLYKKLGFKEVGTQKIHSFNYVYMLKENVK
ncbi:MAG: GNAT family N-acetyltransferase [Treponema sp.]|nr:GNAT family N-acetyltransferase [Treponema sp.]